MSDCIHTRRRKARKPHRCIECRAEIPAGAHYVRHSGIFEGDPFDHAACIACRGLEVRYLASLRLATFLNWDEKTYTFGSLIEEALDFAEGDRSGYAGLPLAQIRDFLPALLDRFDAAEREEQRKIRERRRAEQERRAARAAVAAVAAAQSEAGRFHAGSPAL